MSAKNTMEVVKVLSFHQQRKSRPQRAGVFFVGPEGRADGRHTSTWYIALFAAVYLRNEGTIQARSLLIGLLFPP